MWATRENAQITGTRQIGGDDKAHQYPNRLIVDGQQRLTSLYAVFRGKKILDSDYRERLIEVAFNPKTRRFEVADAAIRRDPDWIPNISDLWASGRSSRKIVNDYLDQAHKKSALTDEEEEVIAHVALHLNVRLRRVAIITAAKHQIRGRPNLKYAA